MSQRTEIAVLLTYLSAGHPLYKRLSPESYALVLGAGLPATLVQSGGQIGIRYAGEAYTPSGTAWKPAA